MTEEERLALAMKTLREWLFALAAGAERDEVYAEDLWGRVCHSPKVLREFAYCHDYGTFLGEYKIEGYSLVDVLVWQVDHFKAWLDRGDAVNRWHNERLLLDSLDIFLKMEEDPEKYVNKMKQETGTDFEGKY